MTQQYKGKVGFTERKKKELDDLGNQVINAQYEVDQLQATVIAVSDKSQKVVAYLGMSEADKTHALNNKNLLEEVIENALTLRDNSKLVFDKMGITNITTKQLAKDTKTLMDKLIYSAEMINKLSMLIIRKKALNPLISDELVSIVNAAGNDANNAVTLTLVALKSTFAAQASSIESEAAVALEYTQAILLYQVLTGTIEVYKKAGENKDENFTPNSDPKNGGAKNCLQLLLDKAYIKAETQHNLLYTACSDITKQLNAANAKSNKAKIKLKSLQSGLAAATAAALAS